MNPHEPTTTPADPAITAVLERLDVPEHRPGFWDDLARDMAGATGPESAFEARPEAVGSAPRPASGASRLPVRRLVLAAAAVALVVATALAAVRNDDGQDRLQTVDTGPAPSTPDGAPTTAALAPEPPPLLVEPTVVGGSASEWFFSDQIVWGDGTFVTRTDGGASGYWTSPDGIRWKHRDGPNPVLPLTAACPDRYRCEVTPAAPEIPFHFALPIYRVGAQAGDVLVLDVWTQYRIDTAEITAAGEVAPTPILHPDLLAAAAETSSCFRQLQQQATSGRAADPAGPARLAAWGSGGLEDPVIRLSCGNETDSAGFTLDLRDHLDQAQLLAVYSSGPNELWVASPGSPARRVDDPPTTTVRSDGATDGEIVTQLAPVRSAGDRFWAVDEGTLVSSADGSRWAPLPVDTGGLQIAEVAASPGGHLALRLVPDRLAPTPAASFVVSHDNGATWATPVEAIGNDRLSVGPAGAAVVSDQGEAVTITLIDDGRSRLLVTSGPGGAVRQAAVGVDRVLVQSLDPQLPTADAVRFTVYDLDGNIVHQAAYDEKAGGRSFPAERAALTAVGIGAALATLTGLARRRRPPGRSRERPAPRRWRWNRG